MGLHSRLLTTIDIGFDSDSPDIPWEQDGPGFFIKLRFLVVEYHGTKPAVKPESKCTGPRLIASRHLDHADDAIRLAF